jgi:hypothetical protein
MYPRFGFYIKKIEIEPPPYSLDAGGHHQGDP